MDELFGCGVNDLPLSMVLSWYEQKAAFISPNVLEFLVKNYNIAPISTPEKDLRKLLGK